MLINYVNNNPDCITGKGADEQSITQAEEKLGITFSAEYHDLLAHFGMLIIGSHEINGFSKTDRLSVVANTLSARAKDPVFPTTMYVIEDLGIDKILILQASDGTIYEYVPGASPKKIFPSLNEYIMEDEE